MAPAYRSFAFRRACKRLGLKHIRTKPYTPRTNGKAERFIHLNAVALQLNTRPRKTLGYITPAAKLAETVASTD
jgi:transposase InsO family protein